MRSEITIFCDNEDELREFVQRVLSEPRSDVVVHIPVTLESAPRVTTTDSTAPAAPVKKERKPRADAGQKRGPYKTTGGAAEGASAGEAASPADPSSAAATPTSPAAPEQTVQATPAPAQSAAPAAAEPGKEPTLDDVRAALKRVSDTKDLGMPACMGQLAKFHVLRVSEVKKEQYAEFIKACDELVASVKK